MKNYFKGLAWVILLLTPILYYIHSFDTQKAYTDISLYSVLMFGILSFFLYLFLQRSVRSPRKQLFISITITNMLVKMFSSIALLLIYKEINQPYDGKFIVPFLSIYLVFTIFETWFMIRLADENP